MNKCRYHSGFTLIEIIISLSILVVGLVALLALFISSFDVAMKAANLTDATLLAQQKMEEIKRDGFPNTGTTTGVFDQYDQRFSWTLDVIDVAPIGYLRRVTLTVSWTHRNKPYSEKFILDVAKLAPPSP